MVGAIALLIIKDVFFAKFYAKIYRPLRWPYFWLAHGLLLVGHRQRSWERD